MYPKWHKTDLKKVREQFAREETERKAEEIIKGKWSENCANCGKLMKNDTYWWELVRGHPEEGESMQDFDREIYCHECIKVDKSRRNKYKIK